MVSLDSNSISDLIWWRDHVVKCAGRSIEALKPDLVIYSDASLWGWGARAGTRAIAVAHLKAADSKVYSSFCAC